MLSIFSCVCWPSVFLIWRNVYLGLPIFLLGLFVGFCVCACVCVCVCCFGHAASVRDLTSLTKRLGIEPVPPTVEAQCPNHWTGRTLPSCLFFIFCFMSCLYILEMNSLVTSFANILSHSLSCLFFLFMVSFSVLCTESFKVQLSPICLFLFLFSLL